MEEDDLPTNRPPAGLKVVAVIVVIGLVLLMANLFFVLVLGWFRG